MELRCFGVSLPHGPLSVSLPLGALLLLLPSRPVVQSPISGGRFALPLRTRNERQIRVRRRASGFDAFPPLPGKVFVDEFSCIGIRLSWTGNQGQSQAIGAEYGEGFETFRMDGPLKVDVDYLNEKLQECFLQRIRHAMKPDEAFGLIFSWDNVIADTDSLKLDAWRQLALEEAYKHKHMKDDRRDRVQQLSVAEMRMLRWFCGHTRRNLVRNKDIRDRVEVAPIEEKLVQHRLRRFGHVQRRPPKAPVRSGVLERADNIKRGRGRPNLTWDNSVKRDLKEWNISKELAIDRSVWRLAINGRISQVPLM
ncbi:hypothetical protein EJB05_33414, partial [Eragrostis curvula]